MDNKALYNLSYGVFVLGAKSGEKSSLSLVGSNTANPETEDGKIINACITNTCIQVASDPVRIAISVLNQNYTCDLIKESGFFSLSVLDDSCNFELIKHFGYQSGRNVKKLENYEYKLDMNGSPYILNHSCSMLTCKVLSKEDLGSHTLFIAEVQDAQIMSKRPPLTYWDYQNKIKPKPEVKTEKKIIGWRCKICGYEYMGAELPDDFICPICGHPKDDFEPIYES